MTVSQDLTRLSFTGANTTDTFTFTNVELQDDDDVRVIVKLTSTGDETTLTKTTHYTVTNTNVTAGATIALVNGSFAWLDGDGDLATGYTMTLLRAPVFTQDTSIKNQSAFLPETHEDALDRVAMRDQYMKDWLSRSIRIPEGEDPATYSMILPDAVSRANLGVGFTAAGVLTLGSTFSSTSPTLGDITATSSLKLTSTASTGIEIYNTVDQSSLYERGFWRWSSNVLLFGIEETNGAPLRSMRIQAAGLTGIQFNTTGTLWMTPWSSTTAVTRVAIGTYTDASASVTATTGSHSTLSLDDTAAPTASSTMKFVCLTVAPEVNYSAGGAGVVAAIEVDGTATALPTGRNAAIALHSRANDLGGIHAYNLNGFEDSDYERATTKFTTNVYTITTDRGGSGTLRDIQIGPTAGLWTFDASPLGRLTAAGNFGFAHGTSALAAAATEGFFHLQSVAGLPTGTPASIPTGQIPLVLNTVTDQLNLYSAAAWKALPRTLDVNVTAVGNVGGGTDDLMTFAIPANVLSATGKTVRIKAAGTTANNADAKTLTFVVGSQTVVSTALTVSIVGQWEIECYIVRTGSNTQDIRARTLQGATLIFDQEFTAGTQTDSGAITVKCTGTATTNNDIVQEMMITEIIN